MRKSPFVSYTQGIRLTERVIGSILIMLISSHSVWAFPKSLDDSSHRGFFFCAVG